MMAFKFPRGAVGGIGWDYRDLCKPYRNREGKLNPHKAYGYLLQPKLANRKMLSFLGRMPW